MSIASSQVILAHASSNVAAVDDEIVLFSEDTAGQREGHAVHKHAASASNAYAHVAVPATVSRRVLSVKPTR